MLFFLVGLARREIGASPLLKGDEMTEDKYWEEHNNRLKTLLEKTAEILVKSKSHKALLSYECGSEHFTVIILDDKGNLEDYLRTVNMVTFPPKKE